MDHLTCRVSKAGILLVNPWITYVDVLITDMFFKDDGIEFSLGEIYTNNVLVASHNDW